MLYIPVETQLSEDYCKYNNLYDKKEYNIDTNIKGYISYNKRRIKALPLGGYESNGLIMPIESITNIFTDSGKLPTNWKNEGTEFDELNGVELCRKYIPNQTKKQHTTDKKNTKKRKQILKSKLFVNQF